MIDIDYWAEAAAIKRVAGQVRGIVPQVRRLGKIKMGAERRAARLEVAGELAGIGARFYNVAAQIIGDSEDDPKIAGLRDQLRAGARGVIGTGK